MSARIAIYDPDLAAVEERTALAHATFQRVTSHLRHTFASAKDLHAVIRVNLESIRLATNRAAAARLRSVRLQSGQPSIFKVVSA